MTAGEASRELAALLVFEGQAHCRLVFDFSVRAQG